MSHSATNCRNVLPVCFPGLLVILDVTQFTSYRTRSRTVKTDERVAWRGLCAPSLVTSQTNWATCSETRCSCRTANQLFYKLLSSLYSSPARISDEDPLCVAVDQHVVFHEMVVRCINLSLSSTLLRHFIEYVSADVQISTWALTSSATILSSPSAAQVIRDNLQLSRARYISSRTKLYSHDVRFHMYPLEFSVCDSDLFEQSIETHGVTMNKKNLSMHLSIEQKVVRSHPDEND